MTGTILILWGEKTTPSWSGFATLGIYLACILYVAVRIWQWRGKNMTVTTSRIIFSSGLFVKRTREIPNFKIVSWYQQCTLWQRIIKAGTVIIEIPEVQIYYGSDHRDDRLKKELAKLSHPRYEVSNPESLMTAIRQAVLPFREAPRVISDSAQTADAVVKQLSLLADLHKAGAITDEEFREKSQGIINNVY